MIVLSATGFPVSRGCSINNNYVASDRKFFRKICFNKICFSKICFSNNSHRIGPVNAPAPPLPGLFLAWEDLSVWQHVITSYDEGLSTTEVFIEPHRLIADHVRGPVRWLKCFNRRDVRGLISYVLRFLHGTAWSHMLLLQCRFKIQRNGCQETLLVME
jgi:hypothetical protein